MVNEALFNTIKEVFRRISSTALRAGREPGDIILIGVTKTVGHKEILAALDYGLRDFGENRIQESKTKIDILLPQLKGISVRWHLIGHLQKNKVKTAVSLFDLIHSVDSIELARMIDAEAASQGKIQRILLQVKLSDEESKHGISKNNVLGLLRQISELRHIKTEGLMTIPPFFDDPEESRPYFRELQEIQCNLKREGFEIRELSMGMSNDFEIAIEEGATMIRVGTLLFG